MITRNTKYTHETMSLITKLGHSTNSELLTVLRRQFPELSATTVHRITSRLLERGMIAKAPADSQGSTRYDSNLDQHDHFVCNSCGGIRDVDVVGDILPKINKALGNCKVTGRLVVYGSCDKCIQNNKEKS